ncbi:regulatory signaling modulator protein AmpE [Spiribacter halobius]|uniref:Regulatory signaling modulator protein AmpE n=1 Tax=Sediminicurvatus halobius TaxID=2182432 RepID=A0A2U2N166_9GAMM|nr:regulatory signaling modulator protein AmpE [Spiribacter halobius]PWG62936.1 hypothetical protein DEM34_10055 [Spiribacter halobius]UEX77447.1 regulatory signaling modulator protein AmpE [Spiribacter halobius]
MNLLALLAALWLNGRLPPGGWRSARGFYRYGRWLRARLQPLGLWNHGGGLALLLMGPLLAVLVVQWLVYDLLFGLGGLALGVLALCFAFGGGEPLETELRRFLAALRAGDTAGARAALAGLQGGQPAPADDEALPEAAVVALALRARTRVFAPVFWFLLLGLIGAFGYRLLVLSRAFGDCHDNAGPGYCAAAGQAVAFADWLPNRLLALALALAGDFAAVRRAWSGAVAEDDRRLGAAALGALGIPPTGGERDLTAAAVQDAGRLMRRALYVWLAGVAVGVLAGFL